MTREDFASCATLETFSRAAKILPLLDAFFEADGLPPLNELQRVGLGSIVLQVFGGLEEALSGMFGASDIGGQAEDWLRSLDDGPLQ